MPDRILPDRPSAEQYKKQAKELFHAATSGDADALTRVRKHHPRLHDFAADGRRGMTLADAQLVMAREHGHASWHAFAKHIETLRVTRAVEELADPLNAFIEAACVDPHGWHAAGTLEQAELILARYPEVAAGSIYSAAALGDETAVRGWLARDGELATAAGGPHKWDALTYLCFSRYLRIDKGRTEAFVATAGVLLEAGASANTGWMETIVDPPRATYEAVIYGAAGLAQSAGLTRLLLEYGANPNDEETAYHVAESYDNTVTEILLRSGRLNTSSATTIAVRKCDWHDEKGLKLALEHGADVNYLTRWKHTVLQHAIRRDNGLVMIEQILDAGAAPYLRNTADGRNAIQMAAYHGRGDILLLLERRGFDVELDGLDALVAACARGDVQAARGLAAGDPVLVTRLLSMGGTLLARFAGADNDAGVRCLLAMGVDAGALWREGDGYWELTPNSTALHVAAWRAHHDVVKTLLAAGAAVNAADERGRTAIELAVRACTDSYWKYRRRPDSVAALLAAGAGVDGIEIPTGYDAVDDLLRG